MERSDKEIFAGREEELKKLMKFEKSVLNMVS